MKIHIIITIFLLIAIKTVPITEQVNSRGIMLHYSLPGWQKQCFRFNATSEEMTPIIQGLHRAGVRDLFYYMLISRHDDMHPRESKDTLIAIQNDLYFFENNN